MNKQPLTEQEILWLLSCKYIQCVGCKRFIDKEYNIELHEKMFSGKWEGIESCVFCYVSFVSLCDLINEKNIVTLKEIEKSFIDVYEIQCIPEDFQFILKKRKPE